ncbi:carbohydrate ABC transporter permease [Gorillibacterium massiliense]|uniref:carbohydrate ABC transporter permease n=1 Tax=Gorillibacterium massiliense TaxID=1280390 RepID=UPI0004AF84DD|nr:carbohydrate ABC transporter permease [Gorillibacterium massiliense]
MRKTQIRTRSEWGSDLFIYFYLTIIGIVTSYPFWNILVLALNDAIDSLRGGVYIWPRDWTWLNFKTVLSIDTLSIAFRNSLLRTVIGVVLSLFATSMIAYTISRKDFILRVLFQRLIVITMYVSGGLIPYYFVIKGLGLRNTFLVYLLPMLLNAFYVIIMRSFIDGLPVSLMESAKIDGANDFTIYTRIVLPLIKPALATIALFVAVDQWNAWFDTFIFATKPNLTTMQFELVQILTRSTAQVGNIENIRDKIDTGGRGLTTTPESIRMAITIVATAPILAVYPFIQKYFVKGITLGAVKG